MWPGTESWIAILLVSFGAAVIGGMGGFGTGILLTAVLTPLIGVKAAVPVLSVAGIVINAGRFWFYRRDFDFAVVKRVLPPALIALLAGTQLFERLPEGWLTVAIGGIVLAAVPARRYLQSRGLRLGSTGLAVGGGVFGFLNGIASGMGVVLVSLLLGAGLAGTAVLATDALVTIVVDVARAILFGRLDLLSSDGLAMGTAIGFASIPGSWLASRLVHRMGARLHIAAIEILIAVGGASLLWAGAKALAKTGA